MTLGGSPWATADSPRGIRGRRPGPAVSGARPLARRAPAQLSWWRRGGATRSRERAFGVPRLRGRRVRLQFLLRSWEVPRGTLCGAFYAHVLACLRCGGRLRVIVTVEDPVAVRQILAARRPAETLGPARRPVPPPWPTDLPRLISQGGTGLQSAAVSPASRVSLPSRVTAPAPGPRMVPPGPPPPGAALDTAHAGRAPSPTGPVRQPAWGDVRAGASC